MHNFIYTYIFMYIYSQTDKRETLTALHTRVTYKQIIHHVHLLPAHHGVSVLRMTLHWCLRVSANVVQGPWTPCRLRSNGYSSLHPANAGVEPLPAQDVQPEASKAMELHVVWRGQKNKRHKLELNYCAKTGQWIFYEEHIPQLH